MNTQGLAFVAVKLKDVSKNPPPLSVMPSIARTPDTVWPPYAWVENVDEGTSTEVEMVIGWLPPS